MTVATGKPTKSITLEQLRSKINETTNKKGEKLRSADSKRTERHDKQNTIASVATSTSATIIGYRWNGNIDNGNVTEVERARDGRRLFGRPKCSRIFARVFPRMTAALFASAIHFSSTATRAK